MPDRLQELRQQRRLVEEHLAWLDREIAQATPPLANKNVSSILASQNNTGTSSLAQPAPIAVARSPLASSPTDADAILAEYHQAPEDLKVDVKRGCLLYFAVALALLFLGVSLLYVYSRNHSANSLLRPTEVPAEKR